MTDNFIKLNESDILKLKIVDSDGNDTGKSLEFDLEDIELPLRYQELLEKDKKNKREINNRLVIIDKQQDHKGKKLMSANEEAKIKAINEFFEKEKEVYDMFLGEGGVDKLLNGRKMGWTSLSEIDKIITEQIMPRLDKNMKNIDDKIRNKYSVQKEGNVLE